MISFNTTKTDLTIRIQKLIDEYQKQNKGIIIYIYYESTESKKIRSITILENKKSNDIFVNVDTKLYQCISDDKNLKRFNCGEYSEAVKYCVNHLL